jgi:hypothetical protein
MLKETYLSNLLNETYQLLSESYQLLIMTCGKENLFFLLIYSNPLIIYTLKNISSIVFLHLIYAIQQSQKQIPKLMK